MSFILFHRTFHVVGYIDYSEEELRDYITSISTESGRVQDILFPNLTQEDVVWEAMGESRLSPTPLGMCECVCVVRRYLIRVILCDTPWSGTLGNVNYPSS